MAVEAVVVATAVADAVAAVVVAVTVAVAASYAVRPEFRERGRVTYGGLIIMHLRIN